MEVKLSNCSLISSFVLNDTVLFESGTPPTFINGVVAPDCPDNHLSIFSLVSTLFAESAASLKLLIENKTQYSLLGSVFLNSSSICHLP